MPKTSSEWKAVARFLDGEMSSAEQQRFRHRLKVNRALAREVAELQAARKALQLYRLLLPPARTFASLRRRILVSI